MRVLIFGATGMVGQGVLRECLTDSSVTDVMVLGRSSVGKQHAKLREFLSADLFHYDDIAPEFADVDACFFCLGVSSVGMKEDAYRRVTYTLPLAAAKTLARANPAMTFVYVSGASTDSSEHGRVMWARVKGQAENALMLLPFAATYMFRPGVIQPVLGIRPKTRGYRIFYGAFKFVLPLLRRLLPNHILTTQELGQAMLAVVRRGYTKQVLEARDIRTLLRTSGV